MTATAAMIERVRRMANEPTADTYDDEAIQAIIEENPVIDARGEEPFVESTTTPRTLETNPDWTATYDLAAAAAQVWSEKAGSLAGNFDFSTADQSFKRSQAYDQAMQQARYWQSRRMAKTIHMRPHPKPGVDSDDLSN